MCGLISSQLIGPFVFEGHLTADYYLHVLQGVLPLLLEDVPLQAKLNMLLQHNGTVPHFSLQVA
jgi:hypothetical protein